MFRLLITCVCLFLPCSYAWTTTVSFQVYFELLETNPIGINGEPLIQQFLPAAQWRALGRSALMIAAIQGHPYIWQIYPSPNIAPNNRPAEVPHPELLEADFRPFHLAVGMCNNLPPGTCCRTITPSVTNGQFSNLPPGAISAFWGPDAGSSSMNGCEERMLDAHYGAPQWAWQNPAFPPRVSGATYILCPTGTLSRGWGIALAGFCARLKRDSDSVVAAPAWVWPDLITVDGVNYTDDRKGSLLYYDSHDRLINLTSLV